MVRGRFPWIRFTPILCSWLNAVEGIFAKLTRRRLKHGVFHSLVDLQAAINRFIKEHNQTPKPFIWKADPNEIIAAVKKRVPNVNFYPLGHNCRVLIIDDANSRHAFDKPSVRIKRRLKVRAECRQSRRAIASARVRG